MHMLLPLSPASLVGVEEQRMMNERSRAGAVFIEATHPLPPQVLHSGQSAERCFAKVVSDRPEHMQSALYVCKEGLKQSGRQQLRR